MRMNLSMLGNDYRYAFEPVSGDSYVKANGCGYVQGAYGLGDESMGIYSASDAALAWYGSNVGKPLPPSASDLTFINWYQRNVATFHPEILPSAILSEIKKLRGAERTENLVNGLKTANDVISALSKGVITVADAYKASKGMSASDQKTIQDKIGFGGMIQANLPWIIGGGAVLVGVAMVMGTRKARHSYR